MLRTADKRIFVGDPLRTIAAAPTPLPPPAVSDFVLWLDFSDTTKLGLNSAGSQIAAVLSKVGPYAGVAGSAFSYGARRIGRFGVPDFNGSSNAFTMNFPIGTRPHSAMMVMEIDSFAGENKFLYSASPSKAIGLYVAQTSGLINSNFKDGAIVSSGLAVSAGTATVVGHSMSTSSIRYQVGSSQSTASDSTSATSGTMTFPRFGGTGGYLDGAVAELMIWNRELTSGEMADVTSYLKLKWGV